MVAAIQDKVVLTEQSYFATSTTQTTLHAVYFGRKIFNGIEFAATVDERGGADALQSVAT